MQLPQHTRIEQASAHDALVVASVLLEAAHWLVASGNELWSPSEFSHERVLPDTEAGLFFIARVADEVAGVMKLQMEDPFFWPEIENGTSTFVHKLAVRRSWAKRGVSAALLAFAQDRTKKLGRSHLRLDCVANRPGPRAVYENFGFTLHSTVCKGNTSFARYELSAFDSR